MPARSAANSCSSSATRFRSRVSAPAIIWAKALTSAKADGDRLLLRLSTVDDESVRRLVTESVRAVVQQRTTSSEASRTSTGTLRRSNLRRFRWSRSDARSPASPMCTTAYNLTSERSWFVCSSSGWRSASAVSRWKSREVSMAASGARVAMMPNALRDKVGSPERWPAPSSWIDLGARSRVAVAVGSRCRRPSPSSVRAFHHPPVSSARSLASSSMRHNNAHLPLHG